MKTSKYILPIIVLSQFLCTSLWFAGNAVMPDLSTNFKLAEGALAHLTSAVQLGFIVGTLVFAILTISDRYSPIKVFFFSGLFGALFNAGIIWENNQFYSLLVLRFLSGFFLAGIYPVGMKIAADHYEKGLGRSLGFLVGALVLGTAFPHLLRSSTLLPSWKFVIILTSVLAVLGGLMMLLFVPNGPYRKASQGMHFSAFMRIFKVTELRSAAFGYFGHMWELYAFWAFVPVILEIYGRMHPEANINVPFASFSIIGIGGLACVIAGVLSESKGAKVTAFSALSLSGLCSLFSPLIFLLPSTSFFIAFLLIWGMAVVADSPMFSTLVAHNAPVEFKGTALTIVNSIGFAVSILSIQLVSLLRDLSDSNSIFIVLALGPAIGLIAMRRIK